MNANMYLKLLKENIINFSKKVSHLKINEKYKSSITNKYTIGIINLKLV